MSCNVVARFGEILQGFVNFGVSTTRVNTHNRLDGCGKMMASADRNDLEKVAISNKLHIQAMAAMGNMPKLLVAAKQNREKCF
jgi:hypothetical protein